MQAELTPIPQNVEAEQAFLGALLINNDVYGLVKDKLQPSHFYDPFHASVYQVASGLIEANKNASPISLKGYFDEKIDINGLTVGRYFARMAASATTIINAPDYARVIIDCATRRQLIAESQALSDASFKAEYSQSPLDLAESHISRVKIIIDGAGLQKPSEDICSIADSFLANLDKPSNGLKTGLHEFDKLTGGLFKGGLTLIGARPAMGKTTLGVDLTTRFCKQGLNVVFFSLEMPKNEMIARFVANLTTFENRELHYSTILKGSLSPFDNSLCGKKVNSIKHFNLHLVCTGSTNLNKIKLEMLQAQSRFKGRIDVVVIDQLTGVRSTEKHFNRLGEICEITAKLKELAMEKECAIILMSQLNRAVEGREDKMPSLADFRDSGSLEQDADTVIMPFRKSYYLLRSSKEEDRLVGENCKDEVDILIMKNRQGGEIGQVKCFFNAATSFVGNLDGRL